MLLDMAYNGISNCNGQVKVEYIHMISNCNAVIDKSHKSSNAPVKYPTMHHFVTEMCTRVHISVTKNVALWDMALLHSGICEVGLLISSETIENGSIFVPTELCILVT